MSSGSEAAVSPNQPWVEFGVLPVASTMTPASVVDRLAAQLFRALAPLGGTLVPSEAISSPIPTLCLVLTGGTEHEIMDIWRHRQASVPGEPIVLLAHPGFNSLPAAMEALAGVRQRGGRGRILYLRGATDQEGLNLVNAMARALAVRGHLRSSRIGLIGDPSESLVASCPPADIVRAVWGPELVPIAVRDVARGYDELSGERVSAIGSAEMSGATGLSVTETAIADAVRMVPVLDDLVARQRLDAVAVRCFDLIQTQQVASCLALARLNDRGIISGCEGDVMSTVAMLWAYNLVNEHPWMANAARVDVTGNTVLLAHCTMATSLTPTYRLDTHFESGLSVAIAAQPSFHDVTLLRIGGADMRRIWLAEGHVIDTPAFDDLCRTQVEVRLTAGSSAADLLRDPLGNHITLVVGHHADALAAWWELFVA